ncbi:MAG: MBL fold metallo-hydrolase [Gammaproteobacteria bacterium]
MKAVAGNIHLIDVLHVKPGGTCAYLITGGDSGKDCALIDCGGKNGEGQILAALDELHIPAAAVKWLIATHAHLDHSGCAGSLMRHLPNAVFAAHPSAVKHLANPQMKLARAVRSLYGDELYDREYGELLPIIETRTHALQDGESIKLNGATLRAIYTPGHAWHHLSIFDESAGVVFSGDSFGVCYGNDASGDAAVMPVMPPTQLNLQAARESVKLQSALPAKFFALTHYGLIDNTPQAAEQQIKRMDEWEALAEKTAAQDGDNFRAVFEPALRSAVCDILTSRGMEESIINRYANDTRLTACGFAHLYNKTKAQ